MHVRGALSLEFTAEGLIHPSGTADAGTVITWLDKAGYAVAASWAGTYVRASYVGNMQFKNPVPVDTRAVVQARVVHTDGPHIHVQARVLMPSLRGEDGEPMVCTECLLVYAAEEDGRFVDAPAWVPQTEAQRARNEQAHRAKVLRTQIEQGMTALPFPEEVGSNDELVKLCFIAGPSDTTIGSTIRASAVMRWIDEAAGVCAARWAGTENVVAAFAGGVRFLENIDVGNVVTVEALLVHTSQRAMHVALRVYAARRHERQGMIVAHSLAVMVAPVDGRAQPVRQWEPESEWSASLESAAVELVRLRSEAGSMWSAGPRAG
jgi:acyl-CoA hydrolase